ncbi:MAG: glycine cleavage system protein GcvH [SAR324 cluster bacterium]|nr:glycine cleavage system protein GcvH [SAR324 cluster bacterium]MBF0352343.1 glycine cleavage system protein GcvH [SAR324 cluster bacterium]
MSETPAELLYTREHEWIRIDGDQGYIGITFHAQHALGDIVFVELPAADEEIDAGDEFGTIESVKAVSSLYMPVSGKVLEVNSEVTQQPELVNEDCYDAWLLRIKITNKIEIDNLLNAEEYETFLSELDE